MSSWILAEDRFVPGLAPWKESLFSISNGYVGTRGTFEEGLPGETRASFINGLFVTPRGELPLLGAVPDWTRLILWFDSEPFTLSRPPAGYRREMDLASGVLRREVLWRGTDTGVVKVGFRRMVSMAEPHLTALEVRIASLTEPVEVTLETGIDAAVPSPTIPAWIPLAHTRQGPDLLSMDLASVDERHRLRVETSVRGLADLHYIDDSTHPRFRSRRRLEVGESLTLTKFTCYRSSRDQGSPPVLPPVSTSFDDLVNSSARIWRDRWDGARIDIDGDAEAELALRYAAFQLIGASPRNDPGAAIGAKLLSGFGYRHHVFWDADIFVVPWLTVTHPDLARSHLSYRFRGLPGARRKAAKHGRTGAFFAWESADTGDETTPQWTSPDQGDPTRILTGELEEHIVADVAYAAHHYWTWSGDDKFMAAEGAEILLDGARYWAGRVEWAGEAGHIRGVIGPDEYHTDVDDSFFTNAMAAWHLRAADRVWDWLVRELPAEVERLASQLGIESTTRAGWRRTADRLALLRDGSGVWEQHAGFFGLERLDLDQFQPRQQSLYELLGEARVEKSQVVKQADVLMAMALLGDAAGSADKQLANWHFYRPLTDHGSSLSPAVHALVAARLGLIDEAYRFFRQAVSIDMADAMGNGREGIHGGAQGGLLQAALFGFGGLGLRDGAPALEPNLPDHWTRLGLSFIHHGVRHEREVANKKG
jgi:kojibiose phosphorylase